MITSRAVLFCFIGGCFYLIAIVNSLPPLFYALMWLTAGILASCFGLALLSLYGLRATWSLQAGGVGQAAPPRAPASALDDDEDEGVLPSSSPEGGAPLTEGAGVSLEIGNAGTFSKSDIVIEVRLRPLRPAPEASVAGVRWKRKKPRQDEIVRRFLIEALPSRALLLLFLPLHDLERGRYAISSVRAVGADVLGLFRPRKLLAAAGEAPGRSRDLGDLKDEESEAQVVVGPRVVRSGERPRAAVPGAGGVGGGAATLAGRSDEFGGTRPYVAGDELRFVHWKSTARRGEMVVREWERTSRKHSLVLWDGAAAASLSLGRPAGRASLGASLGAGHGLDEAAWKRGVEWSLEVALSLANALVESGEPVTLWRLDASPASALVASPAALARAAELLADAQASRAVPLHEVLGPALSGRSARAREEAGRSFIVTAAPSPSLASVAQRLPRGSVTVVLLDISRLDPAPGGRRSSQRPWSEAVGEAEASLREAGLRVLRLPVEPPPAEGSAGSDRASSADAATREALRVLLDERAGRALASVASA